MDHGAICCQWVGIFHGMYHVSKASQNQLYLFVLLAFVLLNIFIIIQASFPTHVTLLFIPVSCCFYLYIQIKGDGNCMFNAVLEEIQFDSDEDERWYNAERLRRQAIAFFCIKKEMFTDWITGQITNIYGWCDKDSEMEPGPFSINSYLKYMVGDCVWGDFIVLNLISVMWGV